LNWLFRKNKNTFPNIETVIPVEKTKWETMGWSNLPGSKKQDENGNTLYFYDPDATVHLSTAMSRMKECGITMLLSRIPYITYDEIMKILDSCLNNGIKFVIWGYELSRIYNSEKSLEKIESILSHKALHAIYLYDEPTFSNSEDRMGTFFDIARDYAKFSGIAKKHGKKIYINLFPNHATDEQIGLGEMPFARGTLKGFNGEKLEFSEVRKEIDNYTSYIETFMPYTDILSSDVYPVRMHDKNNYIINNQKTFYKYLAIMLEKHHEHPDKEFRLYIQTAKFENEYPTLTENSLKLQSYAHMMIGVQGLQYWSVMDSATQGVQTHFDAPFLLDGTPNKQTFDIVSSFNNSDKFKTYTRILPNIGIDSIYYFDKKSLYGYDIKCDEMYEEKEEPRFEEFIKSIENPSFISFSENKCMILNLSMINKMTIKLQSDLYVVEGSESCPTNNNDGKYTLGPGELIIVTKP
jgi:hypothetical protein